MEEILTRRAALSISERPALPKLGLPRRRTLWRAGAPVLLVAVVLASFVVLRLDGLGGNLTGLIEFGHTFVHQTRPPPGAVVQSPSGYDGQFFYLQSHDPLLLRDGTIADMRAAGQAFRLQRLGYPALAFLVAGGSNGALPAALLAVNVLAVLALAAFFAAYGRRRGWPTRWTIALALMPGVLLPVLRDLSDPLATACVVIGVLLAQSGRRWTAALALTLGVLTREVTIAIVLALGVELGLRAWRARARPEAWRSVLQEGWPVIALPGLAFALWQGYVALRSGGLVGTSNAGFPGFNLIQEVGWSVGSHAFPYAAWDVVYVGLTVAGIGAAVASLRRGLTVPGLAACAASIGVLIPTLGDPYSDTRLTAPLFALLLVDALQRRRRFTLALCGAVAGMTVLAPLAIPGAY
jgi:hypothetical protein